MVILGELAALKIIAAPDKPEAALNVPCPWIANLSGAWRLVHINWQEATGELNRRVIPAHPDVHSVFTLTTDEFKT